MIRVELVKLARRPRNWVSLALLCGLPVLVAVFVAGLMVGRTPEYLGKKIHANEVKMTMLALLAVPAAILALTGVASAVPVGLAGLGNSGPHGFSEILYAYTSAAATNGSAFAGLNANTPFFNLALALAMFAPVVMWNAEHGWISFAMQFGRVGRAEVR